MKRNAPLRANSIRTLRSSEPIPEGPPKRYCDGRGYIRLRWLVAPRSYVEEYEHRIVMGRPDGEVHHKNGDKADNRPENLVVLSKQEHGLLHGEQAAERRKYGLYRSRSAQEKAERAEQRRQDRAARAREMADLYRGGLTTVQIAQIVGIHSSGVSRALRSVGVLSRPSGNNTDVLKRNQHIVKARAKLRCEACGRSVKWEPSNVHHRRPRGMGGSSRAEIHSPANLLLVCVPCHEWIESNRDLARDAGYLVPLNSTADPATVRVLHAVHGPVLLMHNGLVRPADPTDLTEVNDR